MVLRVFGAPFFEEKGDGRFLGNTDCNAMEPTPLEDDVEMCLVNPLRNRFRVYGMTS